MTPSTELIDIYDEDRKPTGETMPRKGACLAEGQFMLYALALIEDPAGKFLITRRALDKAWAAGCWEIPGGGVISGENSQQTIVREVREETGLEVSASEIAPIYTYRNIDLQSSDNYFTDIYHFHLGFDASDITLQESEAIAFELAPWERIEELARDGKFLHFERIREALEHEV